MKKQLSLLGCIAALVLSGCASSDSRTAGSPPDSTQRRANTRPESSGGLGNQHHGASVIPTTSVVLKTDEASLKENAKLAEGMLDENGNPIQEGAGAQLKK